MKKILLLVIVVLVIAAGWLLYFKGEDKANKVSVVYAERKNLTNTLEFSGEVKPKSVYSVMSTLGGRIKSINVSEGSVVKKGDTLLKLDTAEIELELEKVMLSYDALSDAQARTVMAQTSAASSALAKEKAKIALALSQTTGYDYDSFNSAFGSSLSEQAAQYVSALSGMTLSQEIELPVSADLTQLEAELSAIEMTIKSLNKTIEQMTLKSEIEGKVVYIGVNAGEVLSPGYPAMVIADTDNTYISAYIYEKDVDKLEEGMEVRILSDPGYYSGTVYKIGVSAAGVGDSSVFDTMTTIEISPDGRFDRMPGAVVDIEIVTSQAKDVLALPIDCFTQDNCIFIVDEEGLLEKRTVVIGFRDMYYAQIVSGLTEGEMVVVSPKELSEGERVEYDTGK